MGLLTKFPCIIPPYGQLKDPLKSVNVQTFWTCQIKLPTSALCPSLTVPNVLPNEHELTIQVCLGDHSWSFQSILAMTINLNSILLVRVALAGQYESFEHVQKFHVPRVNYFHFYLCALKTCSYRLCRTAYMLYSSCSNCTLGMELEDCCKVDIRVNSPLSLSSFGSRFGTVRLGHYTLRVDSYIFLLFSYSILFVLVCSCEMRVVFFLCSYFY